MQDNLNNIFILQEDTERSLWQDCFFVFDTSALLDFYSYPEITRNEIYSDIFEKIKGRLWIPGHVEYEYIKNRESAIKKLINDKYKPLHDILKSILDNAEKSRNSVIQLADRTKSSIKHPHIEQSDLKKFQKVSDKYLDEAKELDEKTRKKIKKQEDEILRMSPTDTVQDNIRKYFSVGNNYSFDQILEISKEGKHRYEFKIPPGYADFDENGMKQDNTKEKHKGKEGTQIFGDLIIWKQILDFAVEKKKDILFVCNDLKPDWCILDEDATEKRIKSPRDELLKEFFDKTGKRFWMYSQDQFIYASNRILKSTITEDKIDEILRVIETKTRVTTELKIIEAKYFTDQFSSDPTVKLQSLIVDNVLDTTAGNHLCGDPHVGIVKKLRIKYSVGTEVFTKEYNESEHVHLP